MTTRLGGNEDRAHAEAMSSRRLAEEEPASGVDQASPSREAEEDCEKASGRY